MKGLILGLMIFSSVSSFGASADGYASVELDILDTTSDSLILEVRMCGDSYQLNNFIKSYHGVNKSKEFGSAVAEELCEDTGRIAKIIRNKKLSEHNLKDNGSHCKLQMYRVDFMCEV